MSLQTSLPTSDADSALREHLAQSRFNMVEQQVRTWDVLDYRVLDVLHAMSRERFVLPEHQKLAYADVELPILAGNMSNKLFKPVLDGRLLQSLALTGSEDILEIGTGSGFTTACLAKLGRFVTTLELDAQLLAQAQLRFAEQNLFNIKALCADALSFRAEHQYDVVVVGAAVADLPAQLWNWLAPHGRAFVVRGASPVMEAVLLSGSAAAPVLKSLFETDLPYLQGCAPKPAAFKI